MPPNRPTQTPPSTGSILLGKYHIGRLLGRGSFAKVYQAHALTDDNTTVAVKIIDKNKTIDVDMEPRVLREIAAMRRLHHHPNILKIYEVMATKSKIYLVVEYASGGELFTKISQRGRLKEQEARRYFKQLVSALNFCHQNGVAHRDVKPQNLLLDNNGNVKISDFGLSALPEQLRNGMLHTACGTPAYTAPEVLSRRSYDGAKADSWSVGVILYLMLSGHLPFDDINLGAMYKKIHLRQYQIPGWVSKSARYLIYRLLDPDPNTRMHMEDLMQSSWFKTERSLELKYRNEFTGDSSCKVVDMNAFDIISMSSGLDLSGLFETEGGRKEKRFTTRGRVEEVEERVSEMGRDLGYGVERKKGCGIRLWKAKVVLAVEVVEIVAAELVRVDIKVVEGRVEFEVIEWEDFQTKLQGIRDRSLINPCA